MQVGDCGILSHVPCCTPVRGLQSGLVEAVRGATRKRKVCFVAQSSKSDKDKEKVGISDEAETLNEVVGDQVDGSDSPVVIEAETPDADAETPASEDVLALEQPVEALPPPAKSGPGALALVLGGIIAGAIGYGASFLTPPPEPDPALVATVGTASDRIDTLAADIAALQGAPAPSVDVSGIEAQLGELAGRLDGMDGAIAALEGSVTQTLAELKAGTEDLSQRIAALESIDPSGMPEASEDQIAAFRERLDTITEEAEARLNAATEQAAALEAQAAARAEEVEAAAARAEQEAARIEAEAHRRAALADLHAAMENGTAFAAVLETLGEVPEDLAVAAEKGVPTLADLQRAFPAAARAALTQASSAPESASATDRFAAFLKRSTGARSLTPREGSDADAVLSRAEAALAEGDLSAALTEVETLSDPSREAMSDWIGLARTRASALEALARLTETN